ncbi:YceI family protein [Cyclobacterium xiamenense]|uniref:YceI family protein n=1 Tax=Cyclobacterium xiamenense TaxID=1297121 RepID=UPI0035CED5DB
MRTTSKSSTVDPSNSEVVFEVKKLGIVTINGSIRDFSGEVSLPKERLAAANFNVCLRPSTVNTGNAKRDEHLRSKDFFFVTRYPKICFQSTSVAAVTNGYEVIGNLSLLETTRKVAIPFSCKNGLFTGQLSLNRMDFKLGEKFPAFIVGKIIQLTIKCKVNQDEKTTDSI